MQDTLARTVGSTHPLLTVSATGPPRFNPGPNVTGLSLSGTTRLRTFTPELVDTKARTGICGALWDGAGFSFAVTV